MSLASNKVIFSLLALVTLSLSSYSAASGFALIENSASGQGNAFAGAAAVAEDASTIWFNPAGMMRLEREQLLIAGHFISPNSSFTNGNSTSGLPANPPLNGDDDDGGMNAYVPNVYWVTSISSEMKFGLGVTVPFGLTTKYNDDWIGRYHAVESDLQTININPSLAYRLNDSLSIGAGINLMLASITFSNAIDFGALCYAALTPSSCNDEGNIPQQSDGFADLSADNFKDPAWGLNLGILYELSDRTRLGLAWRSKTDIKAKGDAEFSVPASASLVASSGPFENTGLSADVTLPQTLSFSAAHELGQWTLLADITWTGWSSFEELRISYDNPHQPDSVTTENWNDTYRVSIGTNYQLNEDWILRGGLAYDQTPIPDPQHRTARIPGNNRSWLSLGGSYQISPSFIVDLAYSHLFIEETKIDNTFESSVPTLGATLNGNYEGSVDIVSAQLRWSY